MCIKLSGCQTLHTRRWGFRGVSNSGTLTLANRILSTHPLSLSLLLFLSPSGSQLPVFALGPTFASELLTLYHCHSSRLTCACANRSASYSTLYTSVTQKISNVHKIKRHYHVRAWRRHARSAVIILVTATTLTFETLFYSFLLGLQEERVRFC